MTALDQVQAAYGATARATRTPRDMEFEILARITRHLRNASDGGSGSFGALVHAVHDNRALWTVFAVDVASPGNALPEDLRARIFLLARFVDDYSSKVLRGSAPVDPLIEVNTAVMRGLRPTEPTS